MMEGLTPKEKRVMRQANNIKAASKQLRQVSQELIEKLDLVADGILMDTDDFLLRIKANVSTSQYKLLMKKLEKATDFLDSIFAENRTDSGSDQTWPSSSSNSVDLVNVCDDSVRQLNDSIDALTTRSESSVQVVEETEYMSMSSTNSGDYIQDNGNWFSALESDYE